MSLGLSNNEPTVLFLWQSTALTQAMVLPSRLLSQSVRTAVIDYEAVKFLDIR